MGSDRNSSVHESLHFYGGFGKRQNSPAASLLADQACWVSPGHLLLTHGLNSVTAQLESKVPRDQQPPSHCEGRAGRETEVTSKRPAKGSGLDSTSAPLVPGEVALGKVLSP